MRIKTISARKWTIPWWFFTSSNFVKNIVTHGKVWVKLNFFNVKWKYFH